MVYVYLAVGLSTFFFYVLHQLDLLSLAIATCQYDIDWLYDKKIFLQTKCINDLDKCIAVHCLGAL